MKPAFLIVFLKEFKETVRDRRALGLLVLFTIMYPVMLGYMLNQQISRSTKPEREGIALAVIGITLELTLAHAILSWLPLEEIGMAWRVTTADLALVCLASVPLSLLAAGLQVALAMNARSFKEAQSVLSLVVLVPMVPGIVVAMLDLKTALWMYLVPMLSNQTLLREIAKGSAMDGLPFVLTFLSSLLPALAAVAFASWRLRSERYVLAV